MIKGRVLLLCALLATYIVLIIYANRALLTTKFDQGYWQNRYEQSQWRLPLSDRVIGDDGLYLFEGYRLIHGGDPTSANAEMPPVGKYFIGASILLFGNGHIYGLLSTTLLLIATYLLAKTLLKETFPALLTTTLLATDPLITNQFTLTMMDALQATLMVAYLTLIFRLSSIQKNKGMLIVFSGVILGLFSATKLPVLTPLVLATGLWYIWVETKKVRYAGLLLLGTIAGYVLPYTVYFLRGNTIIDWLKIQKWIITFYRQSNIPPTWGSSITTLLTGSYQNLFSHLWERAGEWTPVWGVFFLMALAFGVLWIRNRKKYLSMTLTLGLLFTIIGVFAIIPFWIRYLVVVLPLLYIAGTALLTRLTPKMQFLCITVFLTVNIVASLHVLFPPATATVNQFIYHADHRLFADLYEDLTLDAKRNWSREEFARTGLTAMADGEIEHIEIKPVDVTPYGRLSSPQYLTADATFYTRRLGSFTRKISVPFVREDNRWRIPWRWDMLIPDFSSDTKLETIVDEARRGSIVGSDKKPLAEDIRGVIAWVTPGAMPEEEKVIALLETVLDGRIPKVAIHQRIVGNVLPNTPVPIGTIPHPIDDPNIVALSGLSGVTLTPAYTRITYPNNVVDIGSLENTAFSECCTYLYSTTNYDGISGVEKIKNAELKGTNGGTLVIKNREGFIIDTLIAVTKKDGTNEQP